MKDCYCSLLPFTFLDPELLERDITYESSDRGSRTTVSNRNAFGTTVKAVIPVEEPVDAVAVDGNLVTDFDHGTSLGRTVVQIERELEPGETLRVKEMSTA